MNTDIHAESNRVISKYIEQLNERNKTVATLELNQEQAEFLKNAMEWWKTSGVNYFSAQLAEQIEEKLN
jgi:hypothetical protein